MTDAKTAAIALLLIAAIPMLTLLIEWMIK
jgi:hypothetical protein